LKEYNTKSNKYAAISQCAEAKEGTELKEELKTISHALHQKNTYKKTAYWDERRS